MAANDGEKIVEIVRDTARKLAHRFHLLRLAELLFEPLLREEGIMGGSLCFLHARRGFPEGLLRRLDLLLEIGL